MVVGGSDWQYRGVIGAVPLLGATLDLQKAEEGTL